MKRNFLVLFAFISLLLLVSTSFSKTVFAQSKGILSSATQVTLSDAIYADLAVRGYLDNVSVYYTDGTATNDIALNETRHWLPASTVKTYVAMYAFKLISEGKLHLSNTVTIDAKNEVPTELVTNELPTLMIGDSVTIERLIRQMVTQSDNTAFNQLLDILGRNNVTAYIQSLGLTQSHIGSKLNLDDSQTQYEYDVPGYGINSTTAKDYAKAFWLIKNNKIPGSKNLYNILKQQKIQYISAYLPKTVTCGTKAGDLDPLFHDGGICQDKIHSYILTVFTNAGDPNLISHLSEIVYTKNFQLVGQTLGTNQSVSESSTTPIDEIVMNQPKTAVLGASTTINFPTPDITAADLGLKASDLSLKIPDNQLPYVFIPADSPFHELSDIWQITRLVIASGHQAREKVNLETGELRLAEAKDLLKRGKTQQAQKIINSIQNGLEVLSKDPTVKSDVSSQTTIQAISETRFSILSSQLQKSSGEAKLTLIKEIASQAKDTLQKIHPNIPEAVNATSPTQRPLIGTVINSTSSEITVRTAGGQEITIPTDTKAIKIQAKVLGSPTISSQTEITDTPIPSLSPSRTPRKNIVAVGSTIALIGSTVNNHFTPSLILTNIPKELAAPEPVVVKKVDTKHNTMVVEENGVYAQVDINKNTAIKGADTNIPLKSIQAGDIVIVHGLPSEQKQIQQILVTPPGYPTTYPTSNQPIPTPLHINSTIEQKRDTNTSDRGENNSSNPSTPANQPIVIQSTSVQVIEKKSDNSNSSPKNGQSQQNTQNQPQQQPPPHQNQPTSDSNGQNAAPTIKFDGEKK